MGNELFYIFEVNVAGNKLGKGIGDNNDDFVDVFIDRSGGVPQGASGGAGA